MSEVKDLQPFLKKMERQGCRVTFIRIQVLKILLEAHTELSVAEIEYKTLKFGHYLNTGTIYNTLMTLKKCDIVNCSKIDKAKSLYSIRA